MYTHIETVMTAVEPPLFFAVYNEHDHEVYLESLTERERTYIVSLEEVKQRDSLIGRMVAKHAVATFISDAGGVVPSFTDIEIQSNGKQPVCVLHGEGKGVIPPRVSIAHSHGHAVAIVVDAHTSRGVGVDIEPVRAWRDDVLRGFLNDEEYRVCTQYEGDVSLYATLVWCIKEAYLKAVGTGLHIHPRDVVVHRHETDAHNITLEVQGEMVPAQVTWTQGEGGYIITTVIL